MRGKKSHQRIKESPKSRETMHNLGSDAEREL